MRLQDTTGGQYVAIQAPGTVSTSYTLTMPGDDGDADEFLQTNGSGVLTWADALPSQTGNAGETLITDATDASWAPRSGKNYLINGNFDVWQRGTSFAAMSQSYTNYQADRWQITPSGNSAVMTVSRQAFTAGQTDVPNNPLYFCRCDVTTAASSSASGEVTNKIEDVNTLSGKPVVLSFWAKTVSGTTTLTLRLKQNFGSGGSGDAYTALGTANLTTTWTKFTLTATCASVSGKTIGTGSYLGLNWYWNNNSTTTDDIDIAQFQLEEGTVPTLFEYKTVGQTLAACQRFFCKSFPQGTEPANGNGVVNGAMLGKGVTTDDTEPFMSWQYPVIMRAAPSIVLYNHRSGGTAGQWDNHGSASSSGARVIFSSDFCVRIDNGDTKLAAANAWMIHATATAEL